MQIAGYDFERPERHVKLHNYNPHANHDKVYHIIAERHDSGFHVIALHGRRGSSLRRTQKTKVVLSGPACWATFENLMREKIREGYVIQSDQTFTPGAPSVIETEEVSYSIDSVVWAPHTYAKNPVRATAVDYSFDLKGYGVVLLPEGNRVLLFVNGSEKLFYDQHGAQLSVTESLFNAVCDLDGNVVIDGIWDGYRYLVFDMPGEQEYSERIKSLVEYLDGTVDDNVVQMADIYLTAAEAKKAVSDARELGAKTILGIHMSGGERPGQNDKSRVSLKLRPRAVLQVIEIDANTITLGVDDGLGIIKVSHISRPVEIAMELGDQVLVEYDSWSGYGTELQNPKYIKKAEHTSDCSIEQLLTT